MESRTHQTKAGIELYAEGYFRGDIGLNDASLSTTIRDPTTGRSLHAKIEPFTRNCGIKAISYIRGDTALWPVLESFLFHVCRAGIIIGSDYVGGPTLAAIKDISGFEIDETPTWNPVYTWAKDHTIVLFRKDLTYFKDTPNEWPKWKASPV